MPRTVDIKKGLNDIKRRFFFVIYWFQQIDVNVYFIGQSNPPLTGKIREVLFLDNVFIRLTNTLKCQSSKQKVTNSYSKDRKLTVPLDCKRTAPFESKAVIV